MSFTEVQNDMTGAYIKVNYEALWLRHLYVWQEGTDVGGSWQARVFPDLMAIAPYFIDLQNAGSYDCDRTLSSPVPDEYEEKLRVQYRPNGSGPWTTAGQAGMEILASINVSQFKLDYWKVKINDTHSVRIIVVIENHNGGQSGPV